MGLCATDLTGPVAAFLEMQAVDTKFVHPLLKMHVAEVVETSCLACRARIVLPFSIHNYPNHLARIFRHFPAYFADLFNKNLSDEFMHGFVDCGLVKSIAIHLYDLHGINEWLKILLVCLIYIECL